MMRLLTVPDIILLHKKLIEQTGGSHGIRDAGVVLQTDYFAFLQSVLWILKENSKARHFYDKNGFRKPSFSQQRSLRS